MTIRGKHDESYFIFFSEKHIFLKLKKLSIDIIFVKEEYFRFGIK